MWRKKIDKSLKPYLEKFIAESYHYKKDFESAEEPRIAQLWVALALISKQIYDLEIKLNYLERAIKDVAKLKEGGKFLEDIEKQVKERGEKKSEISTIKLGKIDEREKIKKETTALSESARILSEIARGKKKVGKKKKRK